MTQIKLRRGNSNQWTAANPILGQGEVGLELDTKKTKTGDGFTHWNDLLYDQTGVFEQATQPAYREGWFWVDGQSDPSGNIFTGTADDVPFTPSGGLQSTSAGAALRELDSEKLAAALLAVANGVATLGADGKLASSQRWTVSGGGGGATFSNIFVPKVIVEDGSDPARYAARILYHSNFSSQWFNGYCAPLSNPAPVPGCKSCVRVTTYISANPGATAGYIFPFQTDQSIGRTVVFYARAVSAKTGDVSLTTDISSATVTFGYGNTGVVATKTSAGNGWWRLQATQVDQSQNFTEIGIQLNQSSSASSQDADLVMKFEIAMVQQGDLLDVESGAATAIQNNLNVLPLLPPQVRSVMDSSNISGNFVTIPGPGRWLLPGNIGGNATLRLRDPQGADAQEKMVVDLLMLPGANRGMSLPVNVFVPAVFGTAYDSFKSNFTLSSANGFHLIIEWCGPDLGWVLQEARILTPKKIALPTPTNTNPLHLTGYYGRHNSEQTTNVQSSVDWMESKIPDAVRTWMSGTDNFIMNMSYSWESMPTPPESSWFIPGYIGSFAGGVYLPGVKQSFSLISTANYGKHTCIHEFAHACDDRWGQKLAASSGYTPAASGYMHDDPAFLAIYNACVADGTITKTGVYAYTNIFEFWAETLSTIQEGGTSYIASGGTQTIASLVGSGRVSALTTLYQGWGLVP